MQAATGRLHEAFGGVDKGFAGQSMGGEQGIVTDSATPKKRMSFSSASDMSKQQVEELVTKLTIDEMKTKWFDEIYYKVKSELVENPTSTTSDGADTPSTESALSPKSSPLEMAINPHRKLYQATVEDDPDDSSNPTRNSQSNNSSDCSSPSSVVSDSMSSKLSNMSAKRTGSGVLRSPGSQPSSPRKRPTVRFSDRGPVVLHSRPSPSQEPTTPRRETFDFAVEGTQLSAVDLKWGTLIDAKGEPTRRLGEFLRGIANYLIAEYTPTNSLVITPDKLYTFYVKYKVDSDMLPYDEIFDVRQRDYAALEWLYQDLGCSYHLVQGRPNSTPRIPALTPSGFQDWMVRQIQTYPDQEARRLHRIVDELPITADGPLLDGKQERLPRQLSRHLLPAACNEEAQAKVLTAIMGWIQDKEPRVPESTSSSPRESRELHHHRPSRTSEEKPGRYRPDDCGSSRHRHKTRESSHSKPSDRGSWSRKARPGTSRAYSEGNIVRQTKSRSPTSANRYRTSAGSLNGASDDYNLSSSPTSYSQHGRFGDRRAREQEYRYYQGRGGSGDTTPRTVVGSSGKRQGLTVDTTGREEAYEDYVPRSSRGPRMSGLGIDEMGSYRGGGS
ncbi:hypothetical protein B0T10DRAFT_184355 [Thelonectria olida]|uniref:DUF7514 domain-containing protein n=1 Tax=Thelonectria olida TaxID=1576542 RepID=A0A9P8WIC1_9HYPO|nr:hypothetical protein B0T10DRAFT_184355 [Thelonectria olida]